MGYIWDAIVCLVGCVIVLLVLNWIFIDIHEKHPLIYWGCWIVGLVSIVGKWCDRNRRNKMKRIILEDQYNQAVDRIEQRKAGDG